MPGQGRRIEDQGPTAASVAVLEELRRIHQRPGTAEMMRCRPWADTDLLRLPDPEIRAVEVERFRCDLKAAAAFLHDMSRD